MNKNEIKERFLMDNTSIKRVSGTNLKQVAELVDTETHLNISYEEKKLRIYTNKATVMRRLERYGHKPIKEDTINGEIYSKTYIFDTKDIGNFLRTSIFKFD